MGYRSLSDNVTLGEPQYPKGKIYEDEFFGEMEIFRQAASIRIPVTGTAGQLLELEIDSQGCADIGLCYPPQTWSGKVALAAVTTESAPGTLTALINGAGAPGGEPPLPPEDAFNVILDATGPFTVRALWQIAEGYYLYRDQFSVAVDGTDVQAGTPGLPPGVPKTDESYGETSVFYGDLEFDIPVSRARPDATTANFTIGFQGCKEDSICYPPQQRRIAVELAAASDADAPRLPPAGSVPVSEQDMLSALIGSASLWVVMLTFVGLGLLLSFTPCVLPMVPILSGIIAGQGDQITTRRAFLLSLTYVLGMAATYTIAGAAFAAAGQQVQALLQKPWIILSVAGLFVALAAAMFGAYELQLPASIQTRLSNAGNRRGGTFIGTALMGALSALVVTTCVAPPLVAALTVIAQTGDVPRGALALFSLSMGMGIPLLVIGTSAGRLLPKAGAWMVAVKGAFGFLMLGLAVWMLERLLPGSLTLALWGTLVFMAGVFLGAFKPLGSDPQPRPMVAKGFGLLAVLYGAVMLVGALSGAEDPLRPLGRLTSGGTAGAVSHEIEFERIKSVEDFQLALVQASSAGRPVILDFYADWCVSCKEMERYTFTDPDVQDAMSKATLLQADVTANDDTDKALLAHFGIFGPPTIVFFDASGAESPGRRIVGFMSADKFAVHTRAAIGS
jgi:thiol:disulfide interchange protein DsbD